MSSDGGVREGCTIDPRDKMGVEGHLQCSDSFYILFWISVFLNGAPLWSSGQSSCEVRTEFICYVEESGPSLWSSGQSSRLQNGAVL
jgi:hypothetical protein